MSSMRQPDPSQPNTNPMSSSPSSMQDAQSKKRKNIEHAEEQKKSTEYATIMKRLDELNAKMNTIIQGLHQQQGIINHLGHSVAEVHSLQNVLHQNTTSTYTIMAQYLLTAQQATNSPQVQSSSTPSLNHHQSNPVSTNSHAGNALFYPSLSFYPQRPSQPTVTNINTAPPQEACLPPSVLSFLLQANSQSMHPQTMLNVHRHVSFDSVPSVKPNARG